MPNTWEGINFDDKGMAIPPAPPVEGPSVPPAKAEDTDAATPSPKPVVEAQPEQKPPVEKSDEVAPEAEKKTQETPVGAKAEELEEDEKALVAKDGDKWSIKAFREAKKELKKFAPAKEALTNIGSPERLARGLEFVSTFSDPLQPIPQAVKTMTALSPSRFIELRDHLYNDTLNQFPDTVLSHILGDETTLQEVIEAVNAKRTGEKPQPVTTESPKPKFDFSALDMDGMERDYPGLPAALKQMAAYVEEVGGKITAPVEAAPKDDPVKPVLDELNSIKEERRQEVINKAVAEIQAEGERYHAEAFTVVDQGLRELGLEPDPAKDDAKTIALKTEICGAIRQRVEPTFDADPDNLKLSERIIKLLANKDPSARDYMDLLKAKVDLAFQKVADPYVDLYNAKRLQSAASTDNGKPKHERPEIVGNTAKVSTANFAARLAQRPKGMSASEFLEQELAAMPG